MSRIRTILLLALLLTLLAAPSAAAESSSRLLRIPCPDGPALTRILAAGVRAVHWEEGLAYGLADPAACDALTAQGTSFDVLSEDAPPDYYLVYATAAEAEGLRARYGLAVPLGEGFYLLGLPAGAELSGPRFADRLPACLAPPQPAPAASRPAGVLSPLAASAAIGDVVAAVSPERLARDVAHLQDNSAIPGPDALGSRFSLSPQLPDDADYLADELAAAGLTVERHDFTARDYYLGQSGTATNIVGILPGELPEADGFYLICAHYDSTAAASPGWATNWQTMPAPGADDNASGAAAVLEAARTLAGQPLVHGVRFALFAGEEQGLQGSAGYAAELHQAGARILGVINLDMIAYDGNGDGRLELRVNEAAASHALAESFVDSAAQYALAVAPTILTDTSHNSDHASFWDRGYPALLAIEDWGDHTPYYHTTQDQQASLSPAFHSGVTRAAVATLADLAGLAAPDLSTSAMTAGLEGAHWATAAYTLTLQNSGLLTATAALTGTLPSGLTPLTPLNPALSLSGTQLTWAGDLAPHSGLTLTLRAQIDPALPSGADLATAAELNDGYGGSYGLAAELHKAWWVTLPPVWKP